LDKEKVAITVGESTTRLEAFSDGVFAIAITLLILEVKIPRHEDLIQHGGLYSYLIQLWPSYLSYILSFIVIGIYWSNHHWLFGFIKRTDHVLNMLHIIFLMAIAFFPFASAILGDFIASDEYRNAAVTAFCIGNFLPVPPILAVYLYAVNNHRLVDARLSSGFIRTQAYKLLMGVVFTGVSIAVSFYYPMISMGMVVFIFLLFLIPPDKPVYDDVITERFK